MLFAAFATRDDFPHLLGEMSMVFTDELKFEINRLVSAILSVKSVSTTNFPKVSYHIVSYYLVRKWTIFTKSLNKSKFDISFIPVTKQALQMLWGAFHLKSPIGAAA